MVSNVHKVKMPPVDGLSRELIALRVANELQDGTYVNLGIGIPTLVSNWIQGRDIVLQSEIGMLNCGPLAEGNDVDQDRVNASCQPVIDLPGSSYFSSEVSFAMIRGGYMDIAVLGALQVSEKGDLAGWNTPSRGLGKLGNIGGSMDLAIGTKKLIIAMEHITVNGEPKILRECTYPLTAKRCVNLIVTNYAVIEVTPKGLLLKELYPGLTLKDIQDMTAAPLKVAKDLRELAL